MTLTAPPALEPQVIGDLLEGGTLAYQVTVADRLRILFLGGTNFVERELSGLRPVRNYLSYAISKVGGRNRIDAFRIARNAGWL